MSADIKIDIVWKYHTYLRLKAVYFCELSQLKLTDFYFFLVTIDTALYFSNKGEDDFVKLTGMRSLTAFTVCMWMSSSDNEGSPFSYAVASQDNELLIYYKKYFQLLIGGESRLNIQYCAKVMEKKFDEMNGTSGFIWFPLMRNSYVHTLWVVRSSSNIFCIVDEISLRYVESLSEKDFTDLLKFRYIRNDMLSKAFE